MKVVLLSHTPNPEKLISIAAKNCYSPYSITQTQENLENGEIEKFVTMLVNIGHESPLEHISFTFGIEGVSRSLLAQLTRHRIASYSVQSQRYVKNKEIDYVTPPSLSDIPSYKCIMNTIHDLYLDLSDRLTKCYIDKGIDPKQAEKMAIEDARYVLPNAYTTNIVCTFNARSLLNFFTHRCCNRAQWEIRQLADKMLEIVKKIAPNVFKNAGSHCVRGKCTEGKMTCGNPRKDV